MVVLILVLKNRFEKLVYLEWKFSMVKCYEEGLIVNLGENIL